MKIQIHKPLWRQTFVGGIALFLALLVAGCVVTSVYPFYTKKELVFDPSLLGKWADLQDTNPPSAYASIKPLSKADKTYWLTIYTAKETNSSELHLFRLGKHLYLDTYPTNRALDYIPVHQVSKVIKLGSVLEAASLNYHWLAGQLRKHPRLLRHIWLPNHADLRNDRTGQGRLVLTAGTPELQRFLQQHFDDPDAWNQPSTLKRLN